MAMEGETEDAAEFLRLHDPEGRSHERDGENERRPQRRQE
jgi:hypothetical protein